MRFAALLGALLALVTAAVVGPSALSHAAVSARTQVAAAVAAPAADMTPSVAATSAVAPADAAHPYSDPIWFPLRSPAKVGCVYSNCPGPYHGYWAIDFGGNLNDPIYAAGGGIFHIGNIDNTCPVSGKCRPAPPGVDRPRPGRRHDLRAPQHGPGQEKASWSRRPPRSARWATTATRRPATRTTCTWSGARPASAAPASYIPTMYACEGSTKVSFPTALGKSAWNSFVNNATTTPTLNNACMPSTSWGTPDQPTVNLNRGSRSAVVIPSARPENLVAWMDRVELYSTTYRKYLPGGLLPALPDDDVRDRHRSARRADLPDHRGLPQRSRLECLGTHRGSRDPGLGPEDTPVPRSLTHGSNWILYSWDRSSSLGAGRTATYEVARRCLLSGTWHSWVYTLVPGTSTSY